MHIAVDYKHTELLYVHKVSELDQFPALYICIISEQLSHVLSHFIGIVRTLSVYILFCILTTALHTLDDCITLVVVVEL